MNFVDCVVSAVNNIVSNRMRSLLTMLGIIIGISSVIAIMSIGKAGEAAISGEFDRLGANVVSIQANTRVLNYESMTLEDAEIIKKNIPEVRAITSVVMGQGVLKNRSKTREVMYMGITPEYRNIYELTLLHGRLFTENDILTKKNFVVLDHVLSKKMFGTENSVGQTIKLECRNMSTNLIVIGIIKNTNVVYENIVGSYFPSFIYLPVTYAQKLNGSNSVDQIAISVTDREKIDLTGAKALSILERRHRNTGVYFAENTVKQREQINRITGIFTFTIGAIGAISLVVGGIGVMNIMLFSVSERIREIGIRKAIGARNSDILLQFLTEAILISLIGGIIGVTLGVGLSIATSKVSGLPLVMSPGYIFGAVAFSGLIGIFFGVAPAKRAAAMDPIESLRCE